MAANLVLRPDIKVDGSDLAAAAVRDLRSTRVEMSMWVPNRATLRFIDPEFKLVDQGTFAVGKALTVGIPSDSTGQPTSVFSGEITDVSVEPGTSGRHELVVGALDKSHRLAVATVIKSYQDKSWQDIVSTVASNAGLTADVSVTGSALPYVLQSTSDYVFLWDIALRTGCEWWVDDGKLHFKKRASTSGPTLSYGLDLDDFRVRYSGATKANKVTVQGWDHRTGAQITANDTGVVTSSAVPGIGSTAPLATEGRTKAVAGWGKAVVTAGLAVADATEAGAVADAIAARVDGGEVVARGVALLNPAIKVGTLVEIKRMGDKVSGKYLTTSVEHIMSSDRVETRFTAGNRAPVGLADLVGAGESAAPRWGDGLVVGVVTNVKEDPDGTGRVRVKFPALSSSDESAWARVATPGGGSSRGLHFSPEVNDEVLIGFEHGDVRYPVVLGGLWSKVNKPPVTAAADPVVSRTIMSRLGHTFELSDGDGDDTKHVSITLADGSNSFRLGADKTDLEVKSGNPLTIKAGDTEVSIDGSGNVTIKGAKVSIESNGDVEINGNNIKLTAKMGVTIDAKTEFKASGKAGATVESTAILTLKGSMAKIN